MNQSGSERVNGPVALVVDLGGTNLRVAACAPDGRFLRREKQSTNASDGPDVVLDRLIDLLRDVRGELGSVDVCGLAVAAPGPLDPWRGVMLKAPNLPGWLDVPLRARLESALNLPVQVGNDGNLAALGEWRYGAGRGTRHLVYYTVSTGVGSGVISHGRLVLGHNGLAVELGHVPVTRDGPRCGCGAHGCLEAVASGSAIARRARELLADGRPSSLAVMLPEEIGADDVAQAAEAGDTLAAELLRDAAIWIGHGVTGALYAFHPELVVIGGGVSRIGARLFGPVRQVVAERAMPGFAERLRIVPVELGDDAGLLGAAALAFEPGLQEP